jgi:hypothetical protein
VHITTFLIDYDEEKDFWACLRLLRTETGTPK